MLICFGFVKLSNHAWQILQGKPGERIMIGKVGTGYLEFKQLLLLPMSHDALLLLKHIRDHAHKKDGK